MILWDFRSYIFFYIIYGSTKIISYFESLPQVTAFLKSEAKQENIDALRDQLKSSDKVSDVRFVSKQEALQIYKQQNKNDPLLLELVTADILPSSLEISTTKIHDLAGISETLKNSTIVQEVIFPKDIVANLSAWTDALRKIGVVLITVLAIDSIFIMVIIISIRISQRKEEIEIMRLLGATSWYVRWPFIFEGMAYGIIGACVGWVLSLGTLLSAMPFLQHFLGPISVFPIPPLLFGELLLIELLLAIVLGAFSSYLAVLRYLK